METTEQQIVETLATKVMGWKDVIGAWNTGDDIINFGEWTPLQNIADAWMLVDKLRTGDYVVNVFAHGTGFNCELHEVGSWVSSTKVDAPTAQEAISMAVYAAVC